MGHEELISSASSLGSEFFALQEEVLRSYKGLLSSYEEASGSSSRIPQLERELKDLRKHKAQEEGLLLRRLMTLAWNYDSLKKRYIASIYKIDSLLAELEGVMIERNSAQHERDAFGKDKDTLAMIETRRARPMSIVEDIRELLWVSDAGEELLTQSFNQAMAQTIHEIQSKLEDAILEVPAPF
ncbi:hypothetical protein LIER_08542 [Lithospermum erythrorhizon]|uniref:Uncharacterized protein n=1 Tax=Lithospermum erythrorhizon TaxID=34254 RepID=A0AAV3PCH0_LITER